MKKSKCKLKEPITIEAKNAEVYISNYGSTYINDADIEKLFLKILGSGAHTLDVKISLTPVENTTITMGNSEAVNVELQEYIKEEEPDEQSKEEDAEENPEE